MGIANDYTPNVDDLTAPTVAHAAFRMADEVRLLKARAKDLFDSREDSIRVSYKVKAIEALAKGVPVRVTGYNQGDNTVLVAKANTSIPAVGVTREAFTQNQIGYITHAGVIDKLDTNGWAVGTILYVGNNGTYTGVEPTTGYAQPIAYVIKQHTTNGAILVDASYPKQDAGDVRVNSTNSLPFSTVQQALQTIQDTLLSEIDSRATADSSLQAQLGGQAPLTASAFSPISWHAQVIENSVTIPDSVNAWSFGPTMELLEGQVVTIGTGSTWTINH